MRRRIFLTLYAMTLATLLVTLVIITGSLYGHFTEEQFERLRNETILAAAGVSEGGIAYLGELGEADFRITWITEDGTILFDNEADSSEMENHLEREEIRDALACGYGESTRYSPTLSGARLLYTAQKLPDGTILRLSIDQTSIRHLVFRFLLPVIVITLIALGASVFMAASLSLRIVEPINNLNLEDPLHDLDNEAYAEIRPLLQRLNEQHLQIQSDREELEKTSLIRQEFTANASHELKTPLHVISGYAELLESGMAAEADRRRFAGKIRTESQRMTKLVEDIIDLSALDGGAAGAKRETIDLWRIAQNAAESLAETAQESGVELVLNGESTELSGVPDILYSIIYNLGLNAVKYTPAGGRAEIRVEDCGSEAVLSVHDTGIGIPREDLNRIFERFYRVDKSRSKEVGGTGLGLSIVKHAAKIHGASVSVESELGKGSCFTVVFPK